MTIITEIEPLQWVKGMHIHSLIFCGQYETKSHAPFSYGFLVVLTTKVRLAVNLLVFLDIMDPELITTCNFTSTFIKSYSWHIYVL